MCFEFTSRNSDFEWRFIVLFLVGGQKCWTQHKSEEQPQPHTNIKNYKGDLAVSKWLLGGAEESWSSCETPRQTCYHTSLPQSYNSRLFSSLIGVSLELKQNWFTQRAAGLHLQVFIAVLKGQTWREYKLVILRQFVSTDVFLEHNIRKRW